MDRLIEGCARLCLLTRAAWSPAFPPPFSRQRVRRLLDSGALCGLVFRQTEDSPANDRARALLSRAAAVAALVERYAQQGYRLVLPEDEAFPASLHVLGARMPLFLFLRGNEKLLDAPRLAVAGSRNIEPDTAALAFHVGERLAREGIVLVSGGARGVDTQAQCGVLASGGSAILVPAKPAEQLLSSQETSCALTQGRLLLLCDTLPDEPFSAGKAIARNHTLYALGDAALVAAAREGVGGSWHGATDCLSGGWRPVYVPIGEGADQAGNRALLTRGARPIDLSGDVPLMACLEGTAKPE